MTALKLVAFLALLALPLGCGDRNSQPANSSTMSHRSTESNPAGAFPIICEGDTVGRFYQLTISRTDRDYKLEIEETWADGEELDFDEVNKPISSLIDNTLILKQSGDSVSSLVIDALLKLDLKTLKGQIKMKSTPAGYQNVSVNLECLARDTVSSN